MSKYLVVTHQTALSPALQHKVRALIVEDVAAEFAVLVPEAPGGTTTWEGETIDGAKQRADAAKTLLEESAQARVFRTAVGAPDPLQAISDELLAHPGQTAVLAVANRDHEVGADEDHDLAGLHDLASVDH